MRARRLAFGTTLGPLWVAALVAGSCSKSPGPARQAVTTEARAAEATAPHRPPWEASGGTKPSIQVRHAAAAPWAERAERQCEAVIEALGPLPTRTTAWLELAADPADFARRSGRRAFEAAAFVPPTIWLQSEAVLARLPHVDDILRHECVHLWLDAQGLSTLPDMISEALAAGMAGQAARLPPADPFRPEEWHEANARLRHPAGKGQHQADVARALATYWPTLATLQARERLTWLRHAAGAAREGRMPAARGSIQRPTTP